MGYTHQALELARQLDDKHQLESAHKDLSKIYAATGKFDRAYEHLREANRYWEEALAIQNRSQLNVLQTLYETDKKESEIQWLRAQNQASSSQQKVLAVSVGALLVLLATTLVMARKKRLADKRLQVLKEKALKVELDRKKMEEANLQHEINLKSAALTRYSLNLSHKNKVLIDLSKSLSHMVGRQHMDFSGKMRSLVREIDQTMNQDGEWDEFMQIFEEIHPDFMKRLNDLAEGSLSSSELRLAMLLRLNLSSKEIASILRVTPDSVRVARYRLRKKLPIPHEKELANFMVEL
jgi:DNA-binding CsgD family transcriptional regulator